MDAPKKQFYTINEAAAILSVHRNTVRNMAEDGRLQWIKAGKVVRITADSIEQLRANREPTERERLKNFIATCDDTQLEKAKAAIADAIGKDAADL